MQYGEIIRDDAEDIADRANVFFELGEYEESIRFYDRALEIAPRDSLLVCDKARSLLCLHRFEEAARCLGPLLENHPDDLNAALRMGNALLNLGEYERAEPLFDRILDVDPNSFGALSGKSAVLLAKKRPADALEYLQRASRLRPFSSEWACIPDVETYEDVAVRLRNRPVH